MKSSYWLPQTYTQNETLLDWFSPIPIQEQIKKKYLTNRQGDLNNTHDRTLTAKARVGINKITATALGLTAEKGSKLSFLTFQLL